MSAGEPALDEIRSALAAPKSREIKAKRTTAIIRRSRLYRWARIYEIESEDIADRKRDSHTRHLARGAGEWATGNIAPGVLRRNSC